jgi:hypothetical protein
VVTRVFKQTIIVHDSYSANVQVSCGPNLKASFVSKSKTQADFAEEATEMDLSTPEKVSCM